jgi:antitoxin MazE
MNTKIQKWGNSLGLRIPRAPALEAQIEEGSIVEISVIDGGLLVRAVRRKQYRLADLVKGIRPDNVHGEITSGKPVGREIW